MTKQEAYEQATLKNIGNPNGTRMDIIYAAMDIYRESPVVQDEKDARIKELEEALDEIINPIKYMRLRLKEGERLEGMMAVALSKDASHLQSIARKALLTTSKTKEG